MPKVLITHRRNTVWEELRTFVTATLTIVLLIGLFHLFLHLFFPQLRKDDPFFYYAFNGIGILVWALIVLGYVVPNLF